MMARTYIVEFVVESTCVADWFAIVVSTPEGGRVCPAVGARHACPPVASLRH